MDLDIDFVRSQFPAFQAEGTRDWIFFENAGGSYVPQTVIDRLNRFFVEHKVQPYAAYALSQTAGEEMDESYAAIAELSPLRLYAAAIIPGFMLAGSYIIYVIVRVMINPSIAPKPREEDIPPRRVVYWQLLTSFVPLTVLIMLVLGSILGGLATPAEAAAMAALQQAGITQLGLITEAP